MRKLILIFFGMMLCGQVLQSQVQTTAVPFLEIAPDSRASGMGEGGVAIADNAWATFWNPAGYAFQQGSEIAMSHADWLPSLGLSDLWIAHLAYKQPVEELDGVVSAMVTYLNLGDFAQTYEGGPDVISIFKGYEMAFAVGYATKLTPDLGIGVNTRIIYSRLSPFGAGTEKGSGTATGVSFDIGFLYKPESVVIPFADVDLGNNLRLGINISNIGPNVFYIDRAQADPLPMNLRLGFAYDLAQSEYNSLTWITDVNRLMVKRDTSGKADEFYKAFYTTWTGTPGQSTSFNQQIR